MVTLTVEDEPSEEIVKVLTDGVVSFGRKEAEGGQPQSIACIARNGEAIVAGACGRTEFARLFVNYLWVEETLRGKGIGTQVLSRLEQAASGRGCKDALIETLSDRNAGLYARLGYVCVARVERYVGRFTKHIMVKELSRLD